MRFTFYNILYYTMFNFVLWNQMTEKVYHTILQVEEKTNPLLKLWKKILMDYPLPQLPQCVILPYVYLQSSSHSFHMNGGSFDHIITSTNDKLLYWLM